MYKYDTAGTKTGCMLRFLPGTVQDSNFSLGFVKVMYDYGRMKSSEASAVIASLYTIYVYLCNEASAVIASCLYTMYIYLCKIYQCKIRRCACLYRSIW